MGRGGHNRIEGAVRLLLLLPLLDLEEAGRIAAERGVPRQQILREALRLGLEILEKKEVKP